MTHYEDGALMQYERRKEEANCRSVCNARHAEMRKRKRKREKCRTEKRGLSMSFAQGEFLRRRTAEILNNVLNDGLQNREVYRYFDWKYPIFYGKNLIAP